MFLFLYERLVSKDIFAKPRLIAGRWKCDAFNHYIIVVFVVVKTQLATCISDMPEGKI